MSSDNQLLESDLNQDEYMAFIKMLKEHEADELEKIIPRYLSYKPEMAEAALYVAVDRGIIDYDLKEKITGQMRFNFSGKARFAKQLNWEKNNAFERFVSRYDDDRIYELIDNPDGITSDVYYSILTVALNRELISKEDFDRLYRVELKNARSEEPLPGFFDILNQERPEPQTELKYDLAEEKRKDFWKCPNCHESVSMDLAVCWNCETPIPEVVEHPQKEEVVREIRAEKIRNFNPLTTSIGIIVAGCIVGFSGYIHNIIRHGEFRPRYGELFIGGIFVVIGLVILAISSYEKLKGED